MSQARVVRNVTGLDQRLDLLRVIAHMPHQISGHDVGKRHVRFELDLALTVEDSAVKRPVTRVFVEATRQRQELSAAGGRGGDRVAGPRGAERR
jgi:hypothetical protein